MAWRVGSTPGLPGHETGAEGGKKLKALRTPGTTHCHLSKNFEENLGTKVRDRMMNMKMGDSIYVEI